MAAKVYLRTVPTMDAAQKVRCIQMKMMKSACARQQNFLLLRCGSSMKKLAPRSWVESFALQISMKIKIEYSVTVIGEYERLGWGDGGDDFDWYCTSNTDAHVGSEPVYISNKAELSQLMGKDAYAILAEHCDRRVQGIRDAQARSLPLFIIQHPATLAAGK